MIHLPRAMLIDMDDTILSAYARPELAWNAVVGEFAGELAPLPPAQVAAAIVESGRRFWAAAEPVAAETDRGPAADRARGIFRLGRGRSWRPG